MPLKVEPLEEPYLNLTPLVDVILNLLIFFMLGTSFAKDEHPFNVELPSVSHAPSLTAPPDDITVNVFANGRVEVAGQEVSLSQLEQILKEAHLRYDGQGVLIRGDKKGEYQGVMNVLSVCQRAKIRNYSLATLVQSE